MSTEEKYELFDAHLDGSITADAQKTFDALMMDSENATLLEEYKNIELAFMHIEKEKAKEENFIANLKSIGANYEALGNDTEKNIKKNIEKNIDATTSIKNDSSKTGNKFSVYKNMKWALGIAAILAIGFFGYNTLLNPKQDMQSLYASNYTVADLSLERGAADDSLEKIVLLYNTKKYSEAFPLIKSYSAAHADNNEMKIALATCYFTAADYENTDLTLQGLINQNDVYKEKAQWYLALSYIKQSKKEAAMALLKSFDKSHFYADKAKKILKELRRN